MYVGHENSSFNTIVIITSTMYYAMIHDIKEPVWMWNPIVVYFIPYTSAIGVL